MFFILINLYLLFIFINILLECEKSQPGYIFAFLVLLFIVVALLFYFTGRTKTGLSKIILYFIQTIYIVTSPLQQWLTSVLDIFTSGISATADVCILPLNYYEKLLLKVYYIIFFNFFYYYLINLIIILILFIIFLLFFIYFF